MNWHRPARLAAAVLLLAPLAPTQLAPRAPAQPDAPAPLPLQTWGFDLSTSGQNVSWVSPTSVDPAASVYATSYVISLVEATVQWSFITLPVNVTDQIPPELLASSSSLPGPAPVSLANQPIAWPEPPAAPSVAATLDIGLNAAGFGFFNATNVVLGTTQVDLGFPFGTQTVTIKSIRIVGSMTIHAAWYALGGGVAGIYGTPALTGEGSMQPATLVVLTTTGARENASTVVVIGLSALNAPFKGGTMVPNPDFLVFGIPTDAAGSQTLAAAWPAGLPGNLSLYYQIWITDPAGPFGFSATNGLRGVTP